MRIFTLLFLALSCAAINAQSTKYYVVSNGTGEGTSWHDAAGDLADILAYAEEGDEIWVAAGTYHPTADDDRSIAFEVPNGVKLYGGFQGSETRKEQRNWTDNLTILSGAIGDKSDLDNSYTVVYLKGVDETTVIDGFIIAKGNANGLGEKGNLERCGGGLFNDATGGKSNPTIANCTFKYNFARDGAAMYNLANEGVCNPTIINCQFIENKADLEGGAIYNDSRYGICNPTFRDCIINSNEATYGGGMLNSAKGRGETRPAIVRCSFQDNVGYIRGGSIHSAPAEGGRVDAKVTSSYFSDNKATVGKEQDSNVVEAASSGSIKKKM